jgi:Ca2+-dependent lipid-binding protein
LRDIIGELPPWVNFSDVESARWLNAVLAKVWPSLNGAISQTVRAIVEPILDNVKPSFVTYIGFTDFSLGDTAPEVTGIKCLPSEGDEVSHIF